MGIVKAAPSADAIMFDINLDLSIGFIHTAAMGTIDGHDAANNKKDSTRGRCLLESFSL
jgi:hypothetical protein